MALTKVYAPVRVNLSLRRSAGLGGPAPEAGAYVHQLLRDQHLSSAGRARRVSAPGRFRAVGGQDQGQDSGPRVTTATCVLPGDQVQQVAGQWFILRPVKSFGILPDVKLFGPMNERPPDCKKGTTPQQAERTQQPAEVFQTVIDNAERALFAAVGVSFKTQVIPGLQILLGAGIAMGGLLVVVISTPAGEPGPFRVWGWLPEGSPVY